MWCFVDFDFEMCFAPQRRALLHLSSGQMAPHPPLERAYLSTLRSPKSVRIAGGGAAPSPLHPPTRFYFVTGAPCYLLLFLLLFPSTSTIWVPMCFFLRTSFLVAPPHLPTPIPFAFFISINDLGSYALLSWSAWPSPLHPPTRLYFATGAPCSLLLFLLLFPSASMIWVPMCFFLRTSFLVRQPSPLHPPTRFYV